MDGKNGIWKIAVLLAIYFVLAVILPAADDEVYYWCWSKELQFSYYDHPAMTAVLIRMSTALVGDSVLGFRIPACLASAFVIYVINRLTPTKSLVLGVLLCPLFTIGAVLITPDSPLVLFWTAYIWWLVELHRRLTPFADSTLGSQPATSLPLETAAVPHQITLLMWTIGGILLGLGALSKYTMGLAVPLTFVSLMMSGRRWRDWMFGYVYHGAVSFVVALPILIYNIQQKFEPLIYQWQHAAEKTPNGWMTFGDFVGVQMLLFGTTPFVLLPWVLYHFRSLSQNPRLRVCACFYALPLTYFLYKSTQTRLQGNWALVCFISFWPLASEWYQTVRVSRTWRWLTAASFLPPVLSVLAIALHLIHPNPLVPIPGDRVYRQIAMNTASKTIADEIRKQTEVLPIYTDSYQLTSLLRFQSLDVQQIEGLTRPSHFTRPPRHLTDVQRAYVVTEKPLPSEFCTGFATPQLLASIPVDYRGQTDRTLRIWLYSRDNTQSGSANDQN